MNLRHPQANTLPKLTRALAKSYRWLKEIPKGAQAGFVGWPAAVGWALRNRLFERPVLRIAVVVNYNMGAQEHGMFTIAASLLGQILQMPKFVTDIEVVAVVTDPASAGRSPGGDTYRRPEIPVTQISTIYQPLHTLLFNPHFRGIDALFLLNADLYSGVKPPWVGNDGIELEPHSLARFHQLGIDIYGVVPHPDVALYESSLMNAIGLPATFEKSPYGFETECLDGSLLPANKLIWHVEAATTGLNRNFNFAEWLIAQGGDAGRRLYQFAREQMPQHNFISSPEAIASCALKDTAQAASCRDLQEKYQQYLQEDMP